MNNKKSLSPLAQHPFLAKNSTKRPFRNGDEQVYRPVAQHEHICHLNNNLKYYTYEIYF